MEFVTEKEAYENLANAIVIQAIKDYVNRPKQRDSIRKFFYSEWCSLLTDMHPDYIIRMCEKQIRENKRCTLHQYHIGGSHETK